MVTAAQASQVGVSAQAVSRLASSGQLERLAHGVYRLAGNPPHRHDELRAAWLAFDPRRNLADRIAANQVEVVSHQSAAVMHELGDVNADVLEFTAVVRRQTRRPDVRIHRGTVSRDDWTLVDGLPVTTPLRTITDLASARLDRGHLAGVVRDSILDHAVPIGAAAAALGPYAHEYGAVAGDGRGLIQLMLRQAGVPDSLLDVAVSADSPEDRTRRASGHRYVLEREISSGAISRVWRGHRRTDAAPIAVEVLREERARDPGLVARFLRQRTVLEALDHPHLVRVHDLIAEGTVVAAVTDLVDGDDLRSLTQRRALRSDQALVVLSQVAAALSALHAAGVRHGDLQPDNVLVPWRHGEPHAMLVHSSFAGAIAELTDPAQIIGIPGYVAPEIVTGQPAVRASDVYALGVMAYEVLGGEPPFRAPHSWALLFAHVNTDPVRPPRLTGPRWDPVWKLVRAMLEKDPAHRPSAATAAARFRELRDLAH